METSKPTTTTNATAQPESIQYAFPMVGTIVSEAKMLQQPKMMSFVQTGMTLRDYFAAVALSTMRFDDYSDDYSDREIARQAYGLADAMLAERSKVTP